MIERSIEELRDAGAVPSEIVKEANDVLDPELGQVWRARWDDRTLTVLVVSTGRGTVGVVPAQFSPVEAEVFEGIELGTGVAEPTSRIAVWNKEHVTIPTRVLDVALLRQTDALTNDARRIAREAAYFELPAQAHDRAAARRYDTLEQFMNTTWAPRFGTSLRDAIAEYAVSPSDIADTLNLDAPITYALLKGTRFLDMEQIHLLAEARKVPLARLLGVGPQLPSDLVDAIDIPRNRWFVERLRSARSVSEEVARTELARTAYTLAARQTGSKTVEWSNRLRHALTLLLADETSDGR